MPVRVRLRRIGKNPKRRVFFRISVFDKRKNRDSRSIEDIGLYDPTKVPAWVTINQDRLDYWLSHGAQMSETVSNLVKKIKGG